MTSSVDVLLWRGSPNGPESLLDLYSIGWAKFQVYWVFLRLQVQSDIPSLYFSLPPSLFLLPYLFPPVYLVSLDSFILSVSRSLSLLIFHVYCVTTIPRIACYLLKTWHVWRGEQGIRWVGANRFSSRTTSQSYTSDWTHTRSSPSYYILAIYINKCYLL